ncbi:alpha/beta hydrolase [Actinocrinis puniceicyclus]|uniref:Alpha/beta hydrolase n=1 Tax=Actinocrinis puniceicyclus TaxID=977794 RepID=A0A8J7WJZ2_9ACTN|nr:alpha/beta hydrolase [Actinocrinis puniceicyclus]MBS2963656.1 alpha/beta hydrolase [Actinocrinis puniceicyclus]
MGAVTKPTSLELRRLVPGRLVRVAGSAHHVVVDEGQARAPVVVFTSGLGGAWYDWDAVVPLLAGRATLVRFDRPGLGWSQPAAVPPTLAGEAERIRELLSVLDLPGPVVLVGHSLAGFHVEGFARLYPELTAGVVLVDSSTEPQAVPQPAYSQRVRRWRRIGEAGRVSGVGGLLGPAAWRVVVAATTVRGVPAADPQHVAATFAAGRPGVAAMVENTLYFDVAAELLELRCERDFPAVPLQVLAAFGRSRIERAVMPRGLASRVADAWRLRQRDLAALSPLGELTELPDSGHFIPFDRPDAVADAVFNVLQAMQTERGLPDTR